MSALQARVVVLAGPSGSGKSRLAERLGLPVLRLDDFYKDGDDPSLPRITEGLNTGLVDWDHPDSWLPQDALSTMRALCDHGRADVPVYDISQSSRTGWQSLDLGGSPLFVAEGIFAPDVVDPARTAGLLAAAYCIRRSTLRTFWLRLTRDLREHRKPPLVLVRRGLALARRQRAVVADAVAKGCAPRTPDQAVAEVGGIAARARA
ncbi:Uridine kinase [Nocardioides dokdonensis FR1436]|uniref:Uridine kinase n=1 Tax=Nocardioides dokdonensis FR1436 TaxID=1300347 RepID=A0A1A9GEI6_9ACTN|nr:ATP-binding protein [Nocardioides dokdonensis]ANH36687.1 Uridine kinase [Nocardioides dokdonensis FR1436]